MGVWDGGRRSGKGFEPRCTQITQWREPESETGRTRRNMLHERKPGEVESYKYSS